MSDVVRTVDPEVVGLLREVAEAPNSRLFRRILREPLADPLAAAPSPALGRAAAEVHLLRHHREAVVELLEQCFRRKAEVDPFAGSVALNRAVAAPVTTATFASLEEHARTARVQEPLRRLFRGNDESALDDVSFAHLARAMATILPGDRAQIFVSLAALFEDRLGDCVRSAETVFRHPGGRELRGNAAANIGVALSLRGRAREAAVAFARAASLCPENVRYVGSATITALDAGDDAAAILAARHLEDLVAPDSVDLTRFAGAHRSRIDAGTYRLDRSWRDAVLRIEDSVGPATARTLHELADL